MAEGERPSLLVNVGSIAFVLMWSTGHIATKLGIPFIEPFHFLAIRFALSAVLVGLIAAVFRVRWPVVGAELGHVVVAGLLIHAIYLGGVFVSIDLGLTAGALAVITGLQPILTGVLAALLISEPVSRRQWLGLALGFAGVSLVVWDKAGLEGTPVSAVIAALICLLSITFGTIYQKRFCAQADILSSNAIQLGVSATACGAASLVFESQVAHWSEELAIAVAWQVVVLSALAFSLFYWLLRQNETTRVASLFYLMTPSTAIMGWLMFGEYFGLPGLAGLLIAVSGFFLVYNRVKLSA